MNNSPAFLEEFERLEIELKSLFDQYIVRVRCLDALRAQLAARVKSPNLHQFVVPQTSDTSISFLPEELIESDEETGIDNDDEELRIPGDRRRDQSNAMAEAGLMIRESRRVATGNRLRVRTAANRGGGAAGNSERRFVGNMMGGSDIDSSIDTDDDSEEDSETNGLGGEHGLMHSDGEDDDDEMEKLRVGAGEKMARKATVFSDEDF